MRISDWSSDVCSSDLFANGGFLVTPWFIDEVRDRDGAVVFKEKPATACPGCGVPGTDRKSVASGKSVSVRVDTGGRRILKQQTQAVDATVFIYINYNGHNVPHLYVTQKTTANN